MFGVPPLADRLTGYPAGTFLRVGFFTAAVWCVPALRVPLVHSLINHFRKKKINMHLGFLGVLRVLDVPSFFFTNDRAGADDLDDRAGAEQSRPG